MAGDGADALQVPPAIPAVDREDPEGVSGESAAAATAGMVQRFEHNGDTPEAGTEGEVAHER